jgi:4-amino-4-deoxy-L-arabinose transferase-like glycosyltransferase
MAGSDERRLHPFEARRVGLVAGAALALLLVVARRYGWHRDELYFLEASRHLAWGYVDQPPFTPFVARLSDELAPGSLVALRVLPAVTAAVTIVLGGLIARELGGGRAAQVTAAGAVAASGFALGVGHLLSTAAFDLTAWMALLLLSARLLRTAEPRWWLAFGAIAGLSMLNKNLLVLLAVALAAGLVGGRRWDLLRSPWLVAGGVLALTIAAPNLVWQARHGWPQFDMAEALEARIGNENRATLLPLQILFVGPFLVPVLWRGARWLAGDGAAASFRPLLWAWPAAIVAAFVTGGRPYYVLPLGLVVLVAGCVAAERAADDRPRRRLPWLIAGNLAMTIPLALPVLPLSAVDTTSSVNEVMAEQVGWPELVAQVAGVVDDLPPAERVGVVLLTASYGEAGAIDRFGPGHRLPPAHSPHNSYADFRQPTDDAATVVAVRFTADRLEPYFERCDHVADVDNGLDVDNEVQGTPILVCRGLRGTWPEVWEQLRFLS